MTELVPEKDCPFCARIERGEYDGASGPPWDDPDAVHFEPLNPITEGHRLFVPTQHVLHGTEEGGEGLAAAVAHANWWGAWTKTESWNLITSNGHFATQTVPHIHVHFVPRRSEDGLLLPWGLPHGDGELARIHEDLAQAEKLREKYDADVTLGHLVEGLEGTIAEWD